MLAGFSISHNLLCTLEHLLNFLCMLYSVRQREIVGSVIDGHTEKYTIDARDLEFQVKRIKRVIGGEGRRGRGDRRGGEKGERG